MLINTLQNDLLEARKTRNPIRTGLLTALVGEAAMVGKDAGNRESTDDEVLATIRKFLKNAEETKSRLAAAGKEIGVVTEEIQILQGYLPKQMSDEELRAAIADIILAEASPNIKNIMKALKEGYAGLYDGRKANEIIKDLLQ